MKTSIINVHWSYDSKETLTHFATLEINHYGPLPKETTIKRTLKQIGLVKKPIKHLQFIKL